MAYTNINKSDEYFNTKLYSGTGSTTTLTGVNFQPDFVWIKRRNSSINHKIYDSVRTAGKSISSNNATAEITNDAEGYLSAFTSDGFTVQAGTTSDEYVNQTGGTYVAWNWLAGNGTSSNTGGSITSTVSANQTSGFSIVSYTGTGSNATVGHGLNAVPSIVLVKNLSDGTQQWSMYNKNLPLTNILILDSTNASFNPSDNDFQDTAPTSDVFYINGISTRTNTNGNNFIAYCFAEKKGFSKFGSYVANANTDGTFVYTGFKPAFIIVKNTSAIGNWFMLDNKRNTYNVVNSRLTAEGTFVEHTDSAYDTDFLSNGFKLRTNSNLNDGAGNTYIYMAFAENPLVSSTGTPVTAR